MMRVAMQPVYYLMEAFAANLASLPAGKWPWSYPLEDMVGEERILPDGRLVNNNRLIDQEKVKESLEWPKICNSSRLIG